MCLPEFNLISRKILEFTARKWLSFYKYYAILVLMRLSFSSEFLVDSTVCNRRKWCRKGKRHLNQDIAAEVSPVVPIVVPHHVTFHTFILRRQVIAPFSVTIAKPTISPNTWYFCLHYIDITENSCLKLQSIE